MNKATLGTEIKITNAILSFKEEGVVWLWLGR